MLMASRRLVAPPLPSAASRPVSVVVAAGAGADAGHVGAVDVDRDRGLLGGVAHAVDVAGRRETADVADVVVALAEQVQVGVEELLVLDALDDAEGAPGDVIVDARELAGPPDETDDRERSVGLHVQGVAAVAVRRAEALLGGQHVRGRQVPAQLVGDELRGLGPAGLALYGGADAGDEWAQPAEGGDLGRGHALSLRPTASYVQCQLSCQLIDTVDACSTSTGCASSTPSRATDRSPRRRRSCTTPSRRSPITSPGSRPRPARSCCSGSAEGFGSPRPGSCWPTAPPRSSGASMPPARSSPLTWD